MYLDESLPGGGGEPPACRSCRQPIFLGQKTTHVNFVDDPDGAKGLTGAYHTECSAPFASLAHVIGVLSRYGR